MLLHGRWKEPSDKHLGKLTAHAYALSDGCANATGKEGHTGPVDDRGGVSNPVPCRHNRAAKPCDAPELVCTVCGDKHPLRVDDLVQHNVYCLLRDRVLVSPRSWHSGVVS